MIDHDTPFEGIGNFRDFGGFEIEGGRRIARGRLLRSAHLSEATTADMARLIAAPLAVVVDLRRPSERLKHPSRLGADFAGLVVESDAGDEAEPPMAGLLRLGPATPQTVDAFLLDYYGGGFLLPRHGDLFARAFAALAQAEGATLVHCAGGKDRTGLLAAMIRTALGGRFDETLDDFLATNKQVRTPGRMAEATSALERILGAPPDPAVVEAFTGVSAHHLEAAFQGMRARFGSTEAYLDSLGVDAAARARLVERLAA